MSKLTNKYLMKSIHKMIVDSLTEDGVICNYNNKTYDELATYEGGSGHRKAFTNYNERIKAYHNILSTLIGEKRADIYESIPVIDFLNIDNTSLASTYLPTSNKDNPIDSTVILDTQLNDYKPALELLEEDDPYTINRAILGYNVAEHFFNTTSQNASCTSIQVSPYINEFAYMYKGIYLPRTTVTEITSNDIRRTELLCYQALTGGTLTFNPDNNDSEYKKCHVTTSGDKTYLYDPYNGIVLNTSCGRNANPMGGTQSPAYTLLVDELGTEIVSYDQNAGLATLNVSPQDIIIVIPTTVYSSSPNKMIYLKASDGTVGTKIVKGLIGHYNGKTFTLNASDYNPQNSNFYYVDQDENVYQYSSLTGNYSTVNAASIKKSSFSLDGRECDIEISDVYYTYEKYIAYIEDYDSEFIAEFTFQEISVDSEVPSFLRNAEILKLLAGYVRIDKEYYAKASGLLDGYYCEPYSWDDSGDARTVNKWKFINETDVAAEYGISIDIGAKYNPSHILYRGDMIESPLKLTSNDTVTFMENGESKSLTVKVDGIDAFHDKGYYGKASIYYNNLIENDQIFSKTFKAIQLSKNDWMETNRSPVKIESLVNKFDYTNVKMNSYDAVSLSGKANPYADGSISKMKYKNKFMKDNDVLSADQIEDYFNLYYDCIQGDTLNLHINKPNVLISHNVRHRKWKWIFSSTTLTEIAKDYSSDLESSPMVSFTLKYDKIKKKNSNEDSKSFTRPSLSVLTPFDLFLKSGQNVDTILLYPEYADRFPETLYILSKKDLDLEVYNDTASSNNRGACFLYANGKYLMFSVNKILDCRLSKLKKLRITDDAGTYTTDFPFDFFASTHTDDELFDLLVRYGIRMPYFGTGPDCWIYALSPLNASFENVVLYDENDNPIPASTLDMANGAIGASYPDNYFKVTKKESNGSIVYALESANRQADLANLASSSIFVSLPEYSNPLDLKSYSRSLYNPQRGFVSAFASMISDNNSALKTSMKKVFNSLLENWKLSDSNTNPIHLKDVSGLVSNIKDFALNITNLVAKSEFKIVIDDEYRALNEKDFEDLLSRIDDTRTYRIYYYTVERDGFVKVDDFFEEISIPEEYDPLAYKLYVKDGESYKEHSGNIAAGDKYYIRKFLVFERIDKDTYKTESDNNVYYLPKDPNHVYERNPEQFDPYYGLDVGKNLKSYYRNIELRNATEHFIRSQLLIKKVNSHKDRRRFSYNRIKRLMDDVFVDGVFSKLDCQSIDACFGDGAEPILILSEGMESYQIPSTIKDKISTINDVVVNVTKDAAQSIIEIEESNKLVAAVNAFKQEFKKYYTDFSVDKAIDRRGNVNWNLFKPDLDKSATKSVLSNIKNSAVRTSIRLGIWPPAVGVLMSIALRFVSTDKFIVQYQLDKDSATGLNSINRQYRSWFLRMLDAQLKNITSKTNMNTSVIKQVTYDEVYDYYAQSSTTYIDVNTFNIEPNEENKEYQIKVISPNFSNGYALARGYDGSLDNNHVLATVESSTYPTTVSEDVLKGLAEFVKTALEGTDPDGENSYYVKYVAGDDKPSGRENSLYYKRYNILNTRMNMIQGPLYKAASYVKNTKIFEDIQRLNSQTLETYDRFVSVMPVAEMEGMTYLPPQKASSTTIELDGKYYSDKELEALRNQINSACVLTCTRCSIKDSCPFYDQEEVIKLYCTGLETIDLWLKDNELELLETDSFDLKLGETGLGFDVGRFKTMHLPYSDIVKKTNADNEVTYEVNDLNGVRKALKSQTETTSVNLNYKKYVQDDMGWLLGGRYGCVEKNTIKDVESTEYSNMTDNIYDYKYLYNALFIDVEGKDSDKDNSIPVIENDSYITYKPSVHTYEVSFDIGPAGDKKHYTGTTKIKIPTGIKLLNNAGNDDDLYLVSDDLKDSEGLDIIPIIYLGKANNVQFTFDLTDDGIPHGVISPNDTQLYAADVAQWCANYYKGWLAEDPIGYTGDNSKDRDQYWMEKVYKKINGRWCQFDGRKRVPSGYQEPVADPDNFDEIAAISGHPVVNTYVDFLRKVSIRMYDPYSDGTGKWLVPFVNPKMDLPWKDMTYDQNVEIQRKVLPLMKTNLRLVLVKKTDPS